MRTTSNRLARRASLLALFLAIGLSNAVTASPDIQSRICEDKNFIRVKGGHFSQILLGGEVIYAYRARIEELSAEAGGTRDIVALARAFSGREFIKAFSKHLPPPSESAALISEGVQSIARKCRDQTVIFVWVTRTKLRWETSPSVGSQGSVMDEVQRMIEGSTSITPPRDVPPRPNEVIPNVPIPPGSGKIHIYTL
jgi:hypothetical protein